MADRTKVTGLLASLEWEPTLDCDLDTQVAEAIEAFCRKTGLPVPADELFQGADWYVPRGTSLHPEPFCRKQAAPSLRVDMRDGRSFALLVGWSNVCGCGTCSGTPSLRAVESSWEPAAAPTPPTAGEVLGATLLGLFFTVLLPLASRFVQ